MPKKQAECPKCGGTGQILRFVVAEDWDPKLYEGKKFKIPVARDCPACNSDDDDGDNPFLEDE